MTSILFVIISTVSASEPDAALARIDIVPDRTVDIHQAWPEHQDFANQLSDAQDIAQELVGDLELVEVFVGQSQVDLYVHGSDADAYIQLAPGGEGWVQLWDGESYGAGPEFLLANSDLPLYPLAIDVDDLPIYYMDFNDVAHTFVISSFGTAGALIAGGSTLPSGPGAIGVAVFGGGAGGAVGEVVWQFGGAIVDWVFGSSSSSSCSSSSNGSSDHYIGGSQYMDANGEVILKPKPSTTGDRNYLPESMQFGAGGLCADECYDKAGMPQTSAQYGMTQGEDCMQLCCEQNPGIAGCL